MTTAKVTVTAQNWDEQRIDEVDAERAIANARWSTVWTGDIDGSSSCHLLIAYTAGNPAHPESLEGPYTGYEIVRATIEGRRGTFVLSESGRHSGAVARTEVEIVRDSGTGDLAGITGTGSYAATAQEFELTLDYELS
jgi:uncharacterized protein DUF3224